jgi:hypothetical protein
MSKKKTWEEWQEEYAKKMTEEGNFKCPVCDHWHKYAKYPNIECDTFNATKYELEKERERRIAVEGQISEFSAQRNDFLDWLLGEKKRAEESGDADLVTRLMNVYNAAHRVPDPDPMKDETVVESETFFVVVTTRWECSDYHFSGVYHDTAAHTRKHAIQKYLAMHNLGNMKAQWVRLRDVNKLRVVKMKLVPTGQKVADDPEAAS